MSPHELHMIRQWFDSVQDCNPEYLETADYILAAKIYEGLGMRVPNSVKEKLPEVACKKE